MEEKDVLKQRVETLTHQLQWFREENKKLKSQNNEEVKKLKRIAFEDKATTEDNEFTTYNRNCLSYSLLPKLEKENLWMAFVDVNFLKYVNDFSEDGHTEGDNLVKHVAKTISGYGTTVRMHGDEFLILFGLNYNIDDDSVNIKNSANEKNKFIEKIEGQNNYYNYCFKNGSTDFRRPFSCGIIEKKANQNFDEAMLEADLKMYENKFNYKKCFEKIEDERLNLFKKDETIESTNSSDFLTDNDSTNLKEDFLNLKPDTAKIEPEKQQKEDLIKDKFPQLYKLNAEPTDSFLPNR